MLGAEFFYLCGLFRLINNIYKIGGREMRNQKTKNMIINAILLGIGLVLNSIIPAFGLPITPDLPLAMLFIIMVLNREDYATCLIAGIITGIFTALTTKFPGGQVPNFLDKLITVNVMFIFMRAMFITAPISKISGIKRDMIVLGIMLIVGTCISGTIFISIAKIMVGLPGGASFVALFIAAVLPAMVVNPIFGIFLYKVILTALVRGQFRNVK